MDRSFKGSDFKGYLEKHGIEHRRTTSLWPQANGEIERQNRTILKRLRIAQVDWRSQMDDFFDDVSQYTAFNNWA